MRLVNFSQTIFALNLMLLIASSSAARDWKDISPGTTTEHFKGISFIDETTGWVAGWDDQNIYNTIDGGETWSLQDPGLLAYFEDVDFCDADNGMATGYDGTIIYTKNGGRKWETAQNGYLITYQACHMQSPDVGFAGGQNTIFQPFVTGTVDAWNNLIQMNFYFNMGGVSTEGTLLGICMIDQTVGFAAGRTWLGEGAICKTSNGSITPWQTIKELAYACTGIDFPTSQVGYACCDNGIVWKSIDGGNTWNQLVTSVNTRLHDINFADQEIGIAVGDSGMIISTDDGGATWTQENSGVTVQLNDVSCVSAATAFAAGDNGIILGKYEALRADVITVSEAGGTVNFTFDAGVENAEDQYFLMCGLLGASPGQALPGGLVCPCNWDHVVMPLVRSLNNLAIFFNFIGTLDTDGQAFPRFEWPGYPGSAGLVIYFAGCTIYPFDFVTNPVEVEVMP